MGYCEDERETVVIGDGGGAGIWRQRHGNEGKLIDSSMEKKMKAGNKSYEKKNVTNLNLIR